MNYQSSWLASAISLLCTVLFMYIFTNYQLSQVLSKKYQGTENKVNYGNSLIFITNGYKNCVCLFVNLWITVLEI